jgi:hypothetical protein
MIMRSKVMMVLIKSLKNASEPRKKCLETAYELPKEAKRVFFTDEKLFYIDPPVNKQNSHVWAVGRKREVNPQRLLVQRAKFSPSVIVSEGICYSGKGRPHFEANKAKISAESTTHGCFLYSLVDQCRTAFHPWKTLLWPPLVVRKQFQGISFAVHLHFSNFL